MIWSVIWFELLGVATLGDIVTTRFDLMHGYKEMNPLYTTFPNQMIVLKFLFLFGMIGLVYLIERRSDGNGWIPLSYATCGTVMAVINNILQNF
ncbi:MAG: DUF5658 family protein [Methanoregula sp.]|uniref:DUF5658 family protein n=1 Tax=Methanoregula sp. TaxID=2052170 RepID=UPI003BB0CFA9